MKYEMIKKMRVKLQKWGPPAHWCDDLRFVALGVLLQTHYHLCTLATACMCSMHADRATYAKVGLIICSACLS